MGLPSSNVVPIELVIFHSYSYYKPEVNSHEIPMKSLVKSSIFASEITIPWSLAEDCGRPFLRAKVPGPAAACGVPRGRGCLGALRSRRGGLGPLLPHWESGNQELVGTSFRSLGELGWLGKLGCLHNPLLCWDHWENLGYIIRIWGWSAWWFGIYSFPIPFVMMFAH